MFVFYCRILVVECLRSQCNLFSRELTKGLHGLDEFEGERLVFGKLFQHAGHLIVPRPHNALSVDALHLVAHTDDLHLVHHTALFDALAHTHTEEERHGYLVRQKKTQLFTYHKERLLESFL